MKLSHRILIFLVVGLLTGIPLAHAQGKYNLKPGAKGEICFQCHIQFKEKLSNPFVHTPVKEGECSGCHNPHTSSHGKLLGDGADRICFSCHADILPEKAASTHDVVVQGNCVKCHDPHSARNRSNLLEAGSKLCFTCHQEMGERSAKNKFKHKPVEQNCLGCHNPHASTGADSLLTKSVPGLCTQCHKADTPAFIKQHVGYPVGEARCTTCHDPHGSNTAGILFDNFHKPVAGKMCNQCHEEPTSAQPFKTKKQGSDMCRGCHNTFFNEFSAKDRLHWPVLSEEGCFSCHQPHASPQKALLRKPMLNLCGECHQDTLQRLEKSPTKHEPVKEGNCTFCHSPHASDNRHLFTDKSVINLCGNCHEWQQHSTHPIGEKTVDPRNRNLQVDCLSCHRTHGTEYKHMIYTPSISETCTQCHTKYMR